MMTTHRFARRTPSSLAAFALGSVMALVVGGCGAAATPDPAPPAAVTAPDAVPSAGPSASASAGPSAGSAISHASAIPGDVCGLLNWGELRGATGIGFSAGKSVAIKGGLGCEWSAPAGFVSVNVLDLDDTQFAITRARMQGKPVEGVGDDAWTDGSSRTLAVARGALEIDVHVEGPGLTNDITSAETALARLVVGRL